MAFRQPTHAPQRLHIASQEPLQAQTHEHISQPIEEPQDWVLFSPISVSDRTQTGTSITTRGGRFTRTPGRSRIADYSSLGYDDEDGEDEELDSLDSHLPAFRADHSIYRNSGNESAAQNDTPSAAPVLPTHDGLGSFRVDLGDGIQEQLYAFEQYNPRRLKRRRESLEIGDAILGGEIDLESQREKEKTRRIEEWRMEQSRFLLEEIQKETRRRRKHSMSNVSQQLGIEGRRMSLLDDDENVETATLGGVDLTKEQEKAGVGEHESEGLWNRLTQTVIRDLMGIDDRLLAIIFGEALPEMEEDIDISITPLVVSTTTAGAESINRLHDSSWEHRFLERIAREFGILVSQLSDHPGAFSTYMRTRARERQIPIPYAGLPVIPESVTSREQFPDLTPTNTQTSVSQTDNGMNTPIFRPTLPPTTLPVDISNTASSLQNPTRYPVAEPINMSTPTPQHLDEVAEREYWERELDIKMVFRYLRSRITSKFSSTTPIPNSFTHTLQGPNRSNIQDSSASAVAARAARVRQYHPLVRARPLPTASSSRNFHTPNPVRLKRASTEGAIGKGVGVGGNFSARSVTHSSCKSQSAKKSSGSRNYWDMGIGATRSSLSGSVGISTGGMGSWGEV